MSTTSMACKLKERITLVTDMETQEKTAEYHSDPHTHTYEYGPGYGSNGKETRINND
ncbi:hypothetical protein PSCICM_00800 [Pseudomonas cichorii]|nr:hypothetical protein PSCICJ_29640 [Pseudomonas cichorii]GFM74261.1 hypothetical protein PSCICM_00800 [Pseudomonas cichorii]